MWRMPAESAPHERTWMAFPREGITLGEDAEFREQGYQAWTEVAHAVAQFEPVTMIVDPTEITRARRMLSSAIEIVEAPLDEFWMRDMGPTFVTDLDRPGVLGAVDWIFNGWGAPDWAEWQKSAGIARVVAEHLGAERIDSLLVAEGGGLHVDGTGTVLLTETVQLDPRRNPFATAPASRPRWPARSARPMPSGSPADSPATTTTSAPTGTSTSSRPSPHRTTCSSTSRRMPPTPTSRCRSSCAESCPTRSPPAAARCGSRHPGADRLARRRGLARLELHQPPRHQRRRRALRLRRRDRRCARPRDRGRRLPGSTRGHGGLAPHLRPRRRHPLHHAAAARDRLTRRRPGPPRWAGASVIVRARR